MLLGGCIESDDVTNLDPVRFEGLRVRERLVARGESLRFDDAGGPYYLDLPAVPVRDPHKSRHSLKIAGPELASADSGTAQSIRRFARKVLNSPE